MRGLDDSSTGMLWKPDFRSVALEIKASAKASRTLNYSGIGYDKGSVMAFRSMKLVHTLKS